MEGTFFRKNPAPRGLVLANHNLHPCGSRFRIRQNGIRQNPHDDLSQGPLITDVCLGRIVSVANSLTLYTRTDSMR